MNLRQKCLVFLGLITVLQTVLFTGSCFLLMRAENQADFARSSSKVTAFVTECTGNLYDAISSLLILGLTRSPSAAMVFDHCTKDLPQEIKMKQESLAVDSTSQALVKHLGSQIRMCLEDLRRVREDSGEGEVSLQHVATLRHYFANEIEPQIIDTKETTSKILAIHAKRAQEAEHRDRDVRNLFAGSLAIAFVFNILVLCVVVTTFGRSIADRLKIIGENVSRFWRGAPLAVPRAGKDEIAQLDQSFFNMANALSEARAKEQAILNNLPLALLVCSADCRVEWMSSGARDLFNSVDRPDIRLFELLEQPTCASIEAMGISDPYRTWTIHTNHGEVYAEISISAFPQNNELRYLVAIRDVTAREEIVKLKQEFVSVVSHDLRTPLTSIKLSAETVTLECGDNISSSSRSALDLINDECRRLLRLTGSLLDMARIDSGKIVLNRQETDLAELVITSLNAVEPAASAKGVELSCHPISLSVIIDRDRIVQVLINLVSNAVKFSQPGQVVSISLLQTDRTFRLSVKDDGPGIEYDKQQIIFDRFKQAHKTDALSGTGLGLAISKMFVEAHGGSIGVTSEPGNGSVFWIEMPITAES